jgi:hypothetical protein
MNEGALRDLGAEEVAVRDLGERIGYGRMMELAEQEWRTKLAGTGYPSGGEFSVGPCAADLVSCPCPANGCDWCCGTKRVTKKVLEAIESAAALLAP